MITRLPDWPSRLHKFLSAHARVPFQYGVNDCSLFAMNGVLAMTGIDLADEFRGTYTDEASARSAIAGFTAGGTLEDVAVRIAGQWGIEETTPAFANRGDVVLADTELGPTLGLCAGAVAAFSAPGGMALLPMTRVRRAWSI